MGTGEGKGMDRRGFLKLAGLGAVGLAGVPAGWQLVWPGEALAATGGGGAAGGKRWAMVVDMRKGCPDDCRSCVGACNIAHNIPAFRDEANPKLHEIKWIWKSPFHNAFPGNEQEFAREDLEHTETMVLVRGAHLGKQTGRHVFVANETIGNQDQPPARLEHTRRIADELPGHVVFNAQPLVKRRIGRHHVKAPVEHGSAAVTRDHV